MNAFTDRLFNQAFLSTLALTTGSTDAIWRDKPVPGRFRIDPREQELGNITPGLSTIEAWFSCDRRLVVPPLPKLGDTIEIEHESAMGAVWEVVHIEEDDIGEVRWRLIKGKHGLFEEYETEPVGDWDDQQSLWDQTVPGGPSWWDRDRIGRGRPSRRAEIARAFAEAMAAETITVNDPLNFVIAAVRSRLGSDLRGLGDKTLRRAVMMLLQQPVLPGR